MRGHISRALFAAMLLAAPISRGDDEGSIDEKLEAGESQAVEPKRKFVHWNEYEGPWIKVRLGAGLLYDLIAYSQNAPSEEQFNDLRPEGKLRDFRFLLKGSFPKWERFSWSVGLMYDGPSDAWLFRETGVMIAVPELWGHFFIGRTKEGFSLNKVMVGYAGWSMERAPISDALIPILADGIKWLGYLPKQGLLWNVGWYVDWLSRGQSFSTYRTQAVGRFMWLPIASKESGTLLHVGVSIRYGIPVNHQLTLRSRPEAFPAPYFIDTGSFFADNTWAWQAEAYFRPGRYLFGTEYFVQRAHAVAAGNPIVHGGEIVFAWNVTGETRSYNTRGGFFNAVSPSKTVLEGGPGGWEVVLKLSYADLTAGTLQGGRFLRFTPMINWFLSDQMRLEFCYGYGLLDRFALQGSTLFFQSRLQLQL